jgi:hypothetical protein
VDKSEESGSLEAKPQAVLGGAMAHLGDSGGSCSSHRAPHAKNTPEVVLPTGCAMGYPIVKGVQARLLPETGKELFKVLMAFVEDDDFHALLEIVRRGGDRVDLKRMCTFSVSLRPEKCSDFGKDCPDEVRVSRANILHYALCICSFHAAAALLVACPELLYGKCSVSMIRNERATPQSTPTARQELLTCKWYPSDVASFFSGLYSQEGASPSADEHEVDETANKYDTALVVLDLFERDVQHTQLLGEGTQAQRIAAAGCDAEAFVNKLLSRACSVLGVPGVELQGAGSPCAEALETEISAGKKADPRSDGAALGTLRQR